MCYNFSCKRLVERSHHADERSCLRFVGNNSVTHYRNVNRRLVGSVCSVYHTHHTETI